MDEQPLGQKSTVCAVDLVRMAKEDDQIAFAELCERYMPFISGRAGRYARVVGVDVEDFMQEGRLALYRAVKGYNPNAGIQFSTYAITCINNSMISAIKRYMRNALQQDPLQLDELDERKLYLAAQQYEINRPEESLFQMETEEDRSQQINQLLSTFERNVLNHYLSGQPYQEIARALCTSTKAVDNALQRVRRKLRPER